MTDSSDPPTTTTTDHAEPEPADDDTADAPPCPDETEPAANTDADATPTEDDAQDADADADDSATTTEAHQQRLAPPAADDAADSDGEDANPYADMGQGATQVVSQSGNDERGTPVAFARKLMDAVGGRFDLDPCSGAEPQPIAETRYTKADNGLAQDWFGTVYCNPPYSGLKRWLQKAVSEAQRDDPDAPETILCLLPANTSTKWFQNYAAQCDYLCLIQGRLTFHGTDQSAPFASILAVFGDLVGDLEATLHDLGRLYTRVKEPDAATQSRLDDLFEADGGAAATPVSGSLLPETAPRGASGGVTVRDVSQDAPAVPQGIIEFSEVGVSDEFYLEFHADRMGFPQSVPDEAYVKVVAGAEAATPGTQTPDTHHTLLAVATPETMARSPDTADTLDEEVYFCLYQDPNVITDISVDAAPGGDGWESVPLKTFYRLSTTATPVCSPYEPGVPYVS